MQDVQDDERNHPRFGIEFDWLGVDLEGRVGLFASAGYGPVPQAVLDSVDVVDRATDAIKRWPPVGGYVSEASGDGDYREWFECATRGLYAYDFQLHRGPYRRIAVPTCPVSIGDIRDDAVRAAALLVRFPTPFGESPAFELPYAFPVPG